MLGVGGVTEPDQGSRVQLLHALAAESPGGAEATKGERFVVCQAVVGDDNRAQAAWQACYQVVEGSTAGDCLPDGEGVGFW